MSVRGLIFFFVGAAIPARNDSGGGGGFSEMNREMALIYVSKP